MLSCGYRRSQSAPRDASPWENLPWRRGAKRYGGFFLSFERVSPPRNMPLEDAPVALCCDVDPDRDDFRRTVGAIGQELTWQGATKGIRRLLEELDRSPSQMSEEVHFNWFLRADLQVAEVHGNPAWPWNAWSDLLDTFRDRGDEVGWHPHFWRRHAGRRAWFQETSDEEYMEMCLRKGFDGIPVTWRPKIVRTGWDFHTASTMSVLSDMRLVADLSALPGVSSAGSIDPKTGMPIVVRDWTGALDRPYHPSRLDPRQEAETAEERLEILEVPVSTFRLPPSLRLVKRARDAARGVGTRLGMSEPYVTRTGMLFRAAVSATLRRAGRRAFVYRPRFVSAPPNGLLNSRGP